MLAGSRHRDVVYLVSPEDFDRYEELTGWSGTVTSQRREEDRSRGEASGATECRNAQPAGCPGIRGIDPQTRMWCETFGSPHPIIEHRICRAAGNYHEPGAS
jgi:hypothetical protein